MNSEKLVYQTFIEEEDLVNFIYEINDDFNPKLSERIQIFDYSKKLIEHANFHVVKLDSLTIGLIAFYCNDLKTRNAYIPIMGIKNQFRGLGIGKKLLDLTIEYVRKEGYKSIYLETWEDSPAYFFYQKNDFIVYNIKQDRINGVYSFKMKLLLNSIFNKTKIITPFQQLIRIGFNYKINLYTKRDDLFPLSGGGNKARKLEYILSEAKREGYNAIVTTGSNQSNHLRATALNASILGWKTISIIHDLKPDKFTGNLRITYLTGSELRFVNKSDVKVAMDEAMEDLKKEKLKPLYIWGGGHSVLGSFAYYEAVKELKGQVGDMIPDFIVVASGTGTTQAGIEVGVRQFFPKCKVLGVSVARNQKKGKDAIIESMKEINKYLKNSVNLQDDIFFDDTKMGKGYEDTFPELLDTIKWAAQTEGLILDPTYTGKAFFGLKKYVENGVISKGSNVVFWHTGGLLNLMNLSKI